MPVVNGTSTIRFTHCTVLLAVDGCACRVKSNVIDALLDILQQTLLHQRQYASDIAASTSITGVFFITEHVLVLALCRLLQTLISSPAGYCRVQ